MCGLCETQNMCCMPWDVACMRMGMFKVLNPTGIQLEVYAERKEPKLGLSSSVLSLGPAFSMCSPSCSWTLSRGKTC